MSTSRHVQYINIIMNVGGIPCVHRGCSVHRRNTISTFGEDTMSTLGDVQHIRGIS